MALITAIIVFLGGIIAAAFSQQLTDEFKAWMPRIVRRVIRKAVNRLPEDQRERFEEEWRSHVDEVPGEIGKICVALGFLSAARKMTSILRTGRERATVDDLVIRTLDLALSAGMILFLAPLLLLIILCIWLENSGPVFETEVELVGMNGRPFKVYRLSTSGRVGKFLSPTGLCEQLALVSLLRGDLAMIGPRPEEPSVAEDFLSFSLDTVSEPEFDRDCWVGP